jgi:hypothetical protein
MKYLKNRDNFITGVKKTGLVPYLDKDIIDSEKFNEVFQNDITWGDSLVGRLINSVIRKAKIGVNLKRIEHVIKSMRAEFDRLVMDGVISNMETESKITLYKFIMITLVAQLEKAAAAKQDWVISDKSEEVDEVEDVSEIKNMTVSTIQSVGDYFDTLTDPALAIPKEELDELKKDKDDLVKALEKFLESIKEIKVEEKQDEVEEPEEKKEEPKKDLVYSDLLKKNFSLVYDIVCDYNEIIISATGPSATQSPQKGKTATTLDPKKSEVIKQTASFNYQDSLSSINEEVVEMDPDFVKAIKPLHSYFKSKEFKLSVDRNVKNNEFNNLLDSNKDAIVKVYKSILLIKENLRDMLLRPEDVAKHIFNLYKFTKLKTSGDIKGFEKSKSKIFEFNKSMAEILKFKNTSTETGSVKSEDELEVGKTYKYTNTKGKTSDVVLVSKDEIIKSKGEDGKWATGDDKKGDKLPDKETVSVVNPDKSTTSFGVNATSLRKESLVSYWQFIKEADETKEGGSWISTVNDSWRNTFLVDFKNYKNYVLTREEQEKLKKEVDKAEKATTSYKIITDKDPVIEIVRLFNRAFRLHTPGPIPSGRTSGKVSNITFREYEYVGGGSSGSPDNPGGGPYRNIKIFTKWQDAIYDIIGSAKYRPIFNKDSTLIVQYTDPDTNKKTEGDPIEQFGKKILTFMNEMLDNSKMYNSGEQQKFIQKYFNLEVKSEKLGSTTNPDDLKKNGIVSEKVKEVEIEFEDKDKLKLVSGMVLKIKDNENKIWYCWVESVKGGKFAYIKFSRNGTYLTSYLDTKTKFKPTTTNASDKNLFIGKFEINNLELDKDKELKIIKCINIKKLVDGKAFDDTTDKLYCKSFEVASKEKDGEKKPHLINNPKGYSSVDQKQGQSPYPDMLG